MFSRSIRVLACVLALSAGITAVSTGTARAVTGSTSLTAGVVGYGTVHVASTSPPPDCTSPASNPGSTNANLNAGHEYDCAPIASSSYDSCVSDGSGSACQITLQAQPVDSSGWRFDHWSGDCTGTAASCTLATRQQDCDPSVKPPCTWMYFGPYTAVAHFVDTRAPTTTLSTAPANNSVVYSDTASQRFTWATNEDTEALAFACNRDAGMFSACSSGLTWSSIADGIHDFCVHGTDASGLQGGDTCRHWEQETSPTATILTHPAATTGMPGASFTYTSNKAGRTDGVTLSYQCSLDAADFVACPASGTSFSLLANGQHTFQVQAAFTAALGGGAHISAAASYTWTQADVTGPTITLTGGPASLTTSTDGTISWTGDEPSEDQTFACKLNDDPNGFEPCTSPQMLSGLSDGTYHFYIQGRDLVGNTGPTTAYTWTVDTSAPTVALHRLATFTLANSLSLSWSGSDGAGSGINRYRYRYQRAAWNSGFGRWTAASAWQATSTASVPLAPGYTYCFQVQAEDRVGHLSGWSAARCTVRALDDRALAASRGWTRAKSSRYYLDTYTTTKRRGATLSKTGVRLDRVAIVAARCPSCGTIGVYTGMKLIAKINLKHATTQRKVIITLPKFGRRTATVKIKVLSPGKPVQIDGLAVSRS